MRVFNIVLLVLAYVFAVAATRSIQPDTAALRKAPKGTVSSRASHNERMTNAIRLRRGLPPLRPHVIPRQHVHGTPTVNDGLHLVARSAPSPSTSASPSGVPPPASFTGVVKLNSKVDGTFIGFLSSSFKVFGEYGTVTSLDDALRVSIAGLRPGLNGPVALRGVNAPDSDFPFVGAVNGFASDSDVLAPGSPNYKYVAGTAAAPAWSTPLTDNGNAFTENTGIVESSETSVWFVNTFSKEVTAQWINPDGKPALRTDILFYPTDGVLVFTGDAPAFTAAFGDAVPVTLSLFETA